MKVGLTNFQFPVSKITNSILQLREVCLQMQRPGSKCDKVQTFSGILWDARRSGNDCIAELEIWVFVLLYFEALFSPN
jgi:hypothetical protein